MPELEMDMGFEPWLVALHTYEARVYWNRYWGGFLRRESQYTQDQPAPAALERRIRTLNPDARIVWNAKYQWYELTVLRTVSLFIGPVDEADDSTMVMQITVHYPIGPYRDSNTKAGTYPSEDFWPTTKQLLLMNQKAWDLWQAAIAKAERERTDKIVERQYCANEEALERAREHDREELRLGSDFVCTDGLGPNLGGKHFGGPFTREVAS